MSMPAIMSDACDREEHRRYDTTTPYPWGDWIYATNGHIMVRCPLRSDPEIKLADGRKVPNPMPIVDDRDSERYTVTLPAAHENKPCEWCNGTGTTDRYQCNNCGDTQVFKVNGKPVLIDCPDCDGTGHVQNCEPVLVMDSPRYYLAAGYIGMLRRHGVRCVSVPATIGKPVTFSGDGFEGWLMPLDTKRTEEDLAREGKLERAAREA